MTRSSKRRTKRREGPAGVRPHEESAEDAFEPWTERQTPSTLLRVSPVTEKRYASLLKYRQSAGLFQSRI